METQEQEYCGTCEMWTSLIKTWYRQRHKASSFSHRNGVYLVPCHVALCAVLFICFPFIIKSTFPIFNRLRQVDFVFRNLLFYHYHDISTPTLLSFIKFFVASFYFFVMDQVTYLLSKQKYQYQKLSIVSLKNLNYGLLWSN